MAAECPLAERRIVEIKMGRSKFPGKPSKIGNRKRVNLSSCALPEENESSKAAENIYLGLSMFNETFGDNEMTPLGPFHGFSYEDMEDAMAEARLQQRESEIEHKRQGINVNLQESFQSELLSITGSLSLNGNHDKNKTKLCFDGGGSINVHDCAQTLQNSESKPFLIDKVTSNVFDCINEKQNECKNRNNAAGKLVKTSQTLRTANSKRNIFKLPKKQNSFKSLQSRAAKRLLEKAKMSNLNDLNKSNTSERKFILPTYSMHSLRVIKPNKRFIEDSDNRKDRLKAKSRSLSGGKVFVLRDRKFGTENLCNKEVTNSSGDKSMKVEYITEEKEKMKLKCAVDLGKTNVNYTSTGRLILREPKLQLVRIDLGVTEGPFSSSNRSSSLSPNSQINPNPIPSSLMHKTVKCGVCGSVKFYKFIELSKKFGIFCCELCRKFISRIIKSLESDSNLKLLCIKGKGLCLVSPLVKSQHTSTIGMQCQACWLKLCIKNFKMSNKLKTKLSKLLPAEMQCSVSLDSSVSKDDTNTFGITSSNIKDFKWLNRSECKMYNEKIRKKSKSNNEVENEEVQSFDSSTRIKERSLRKANSSNRIENKRKLLRHKGRARSSDSVNRQKIDLKGPRVKNVCRSASIVLGQPIATFPRESSPRKQTGDSQFETVKICDKTEATKSSCVESQGLLTVDKNGKGVTVSETKQSVTEKKSSSTASKQVAKPSPPQQQQQQQQNQSGRTKRKSNSKTENPISIDFWETYDPEEICETGFGLIGSENFSVRTLCFLCGSSGQEKLIHCASCCEPYHEFCVDEEQVKAQDELWKYDWICPRCTVCFTCGKTSGQQLKCVKCDNSYHIECVDRVGGRLLHSPDRPWVCSVCLRCKSCNGVDVSVFVGNLPLCRPCFALRQKGNYCPLCQRCYEDDDYDSKMMECGQCKCWVHAKCEGLSDEKYQVLSFLPESVEYICRMCCVMPPAPWWIAVEAELKSGYLGVLKALSKNRKACAMLKWSPRKQCTCRQVNFTPRILDFEESKSVKLTNDQSKEEVKSVEYPESLSDERVKEENNRPAPVLERKTSIEVINHQTGSLKLTLKIMKGTENGGKMKVNDAETESVDQSVKIKNIKNMCEKFNIKECSVRVKKCPFNENSESPGNSDDCQEESNFESASELSEKRSLSSPLNPSSDSGIGSIDDELKPNSLIDEESCKLDDHSSSRIPEVKPSIDPAVSFLEEKKECVCFLEVDSYSSRSKPFSPNLLAIKKKVTTSEYSSLQQFHMDMQRMIATTQSTELMEMYHQTVKEIFPWFDPKYSRVYSNSQKISGTVSVESTPAKNSPIKSISSEDCLVPKEKLFGQPLEYYYSGCTMEDNRSCLLCKEIGDGIPNNTGRLLYCGQNEWVHCNCALWSAEVFEEIDGSLQNVHSAINRGRSIRCPECNLKGASIGCCARNCTESFHFSCARKVGCAFMDDKTVYCPAHVNETKGKVVQNEKEFEIRRPVYVELDKRKMKMVDSSQVRFAVGGLHIENLGRFVLKLSDYPDAIVPEQFQCTRLFWSCYEPWKIVKYHFTVRLQEDEDVEGFDFGVNITVDHSKAPELLKLKLQQLKYFQEHHRLLEIEEPVPEDVVIEKRHLNESKTIEDDKSKGDEVKPVPPKRQKKENKIVRKIVDMFDPREDESCLSDSQNTADLLPPELEEAIFKDLPNDILDGISMQDIFMDIKADLYDNGEKEVKDVEESLDVDDMLPNDMSKTRKIDGNGESNNQNDWPAAEESKQNIYEWTDETNLKTNRDLKRSRSDILPSRRNIMLKNNQRSCSLNWNCKMDIHTTRWKRNVKCHTAGNLLESQERGNMLQELKFTDGLVMVSTESLTSVKDLKDRLTMQQEEGKENKCVPWHMRLQPRLLQVDGNVDSSSSGSEAGESPQRLMEESLVNTRGVAPPQNSTFTSNTPYTDMNTEFATSSQIGYPYLPPSFNLPQIDGLDDASSDDSDFDYYKPVKRRNNGYAQLSKYKISQVDGSADSENESRINHEDDLGLPIGNSSVSDEPVKCSQCRCTYRTKMSYERHLENCCNDYILFSSDGEGSEEEMPFHQTKIEEKKEEVRKEEHKPGVKENGEKSPKITPPKVKVEPQKEHSPVKTEVKKEKVKKTQVKRKQQNVSISKKTPVLANSQSVPQLIVPQNAIPPTVIVQDIGQPNLVQGAFIDPGPAIQYVTSLETQGAFNKPQLIATPSTIMHGGFHIQAPDAQLISSLPVLPQNVQTNLPGIIFPQPQVTGTLISSQPTSVVMSGDQMMLGTAPLLEVIHDPQTGGMFLASHNQPVFYNMETIVSNTVMQTNQYVSNMMIESSFSQTSTQVVQTSKLEQVMNVPSNFILVGQNSTSDKLISSGDLICLPASQPIIQNQASMQAVVSPIIQASQPFNGEHKIIPAPVNTAVRCVQPLPTKRMCSSAVLNKTSNNQPLSRTPEVRPRVTATYYNKNLQSKQNNSSFRGMPMMRPNVTKSPPRQYEKAVIVPKKPRAIVDYINNFKSESCDVCTPTKAEEEPKVEYIPKIEPKTSPPKKKEAVIAPTPVLHLPVLDIEEPKADVEQAKEPEVIKTDSPAPVAVDDDTPKTSQPSEEPKQVDVEIELVVSDKEQEKEEVEAVTEANPEVEKEEVPEEKNEEIVEPEVQEKEIVEEISELNEELPPIVEAIPVMSPMPLQETSPATNSPNTPPKVVSNEKLKETTRILNSNQNCVATKLMSIHPRLIQNPDVESETETENKNKFNFNGKAEDKGPKLIFDVTSDDGFKSSSTSMAELWAKICDSVQEMRAVFKIPPLPISRKGHEILGMQNHGLQHCLEQLRGVEHCVKYKCKYFVKERNEKPVDDRLGVVKENLSGCARTEAFCERKEYDMFAWLASRHRRLPKLSETSEEVLSSARRAISLPMAMRYRHLRETAKTYVGVYRSKIHGKGLFCLREIEAGEMVIEYAGEVIRSNITDKREKYYTDKGIGCYMFRIDDHFVVDATMKGNAARFINHSCEPNCYSRVVDILGKKHIVIFALRRIHVMEELTYDYKFPFEDEKISCHCLSKKCRKYLN